MFTPGFYICFEYFENCEPFSFVSLRKEKKPKPNQNPNPHPPSPWDGANGRQLLFGVASPASPPPGSSGVLCCPVPPRLPLRSLSPPAGRGGRRGAGLGAGSRAGTTPLSPAIGSGGSAPALLSQSSTSPALTAQHVHLRRLGRTIETLLKRGGTVSSAGTGAVRAAARPAR